MKKTILSAFATAGLVSSASADHIWINEFHYDNVGADAGEFVEIALRNPNASGFTAMDYSILLYNGNGGTVYGDPIGNLTTADTISAPLAIDGSAAEITLYSFAIAGIQNGAPDGIALVNITNSTVESFLSYEGTFTATDGLAAGLTSLDVGGEIGTEPGGSLEATGVGIGADQFDATSFALTTTATPGTQNGGQVFAVPEPGAVSLLGLAGIFAIARRRRS